MEVYLSGKRNIYEEIVETYAKYIRTGALRAGEKLPSCRGLAMQLGINPNTVERAYSELEKRGLIRTLPKKGAFVRAEAEEKPPDVPGTESGEADSDTARDPAGGTPDLPGTESGRTGGKTTTAEGPPQAEQAGGSADTGAAAAQDKKKPAAKQGALAGAERQEALAGAERQEALLRAKEALLRLRQAGVSAAEAHALIKQLFGEAEKGEKR